MEVEIVSLHEWIILLKYRALGRKVNFNLKKKLALRICRHLKEFHAKRKIHGDLSLNNLMTYGNLEIVDRDIAHKASPESFKSYLGTYQRGDVKLLVPFSVFDAPEIRFGDSSRSMVTDMYSLGVILGSISTESVPDGMYLNWPASKCGLLNIARKCTDETPYLRPTLNRVIKEVKKLKVEDRKKGNNNEEVTMSKLSEKCKGNEPQDVDESKDEMLNMLKTMTQMREKMIKKDEKRKKNEERGKATIAKLKIENAKVRKRLFEVLEGEKRGKKKLDRLKRENARMMKELKAAHESHVKIVESLEKNEAEIVKRMQAMGEQVTANYETALNDASERYKSLSVKFKRAEVDWKAKGKYVKKMDSEEVIRVKTKTYLEIAHRYRHGTDGWAIDYGKCIEVYDIILNHTQGKGRIDGNACWNLATIYRDGLYGEADPKTAELFFEKAAECFRGKELSELTPVECSSLGMMYVCGDGGLKKDVDLGMDLIQRASRRGDPVATMNCATFFVANQQNVRFVEYLKMAAEARLPDAMFELGRLYNEGFEDIVEVDLEKAYLWFRRAATQKERLSLLEMAHFYEKGKGGVEVDLKKAEKLLYRASDMGLNVYENTQRIRKLIEKQQDEKK